MTVAYVRVSTILQNEARQKELLKGFDYDKIYIEKLSGAKMENRPALNEMLEFVREGDVIICHSIDRLARNHKDLCDIINKCKSKGVAIRFISQNLDTSQGTLTEMLISILGFIAQMEYEHIKERQKEGIAIQKAKGTLKSGRPRIAIEKGKFDEVLKECEFNLSKTARALGISRVSLYRYMENIKDEK